MTISISSTNRRPTQRPQRHSRIFRGRIFALLHASDKRWIFCVAHRRAGKTVALVNQLIRAALSNPRRHPPPRYAYVGPSFDQVKDLCWGYLKHYTQQLSRDSLSRGRAHGDFPHRRDHSALRRRAGL